MTERGDFNSMMNYNLIIVNHEVLLNLTMSGEFLNN